MKKLLLCLLPAACVTVPEGIPPSAYTDAWQCHVRFVDTEPAVSVIHLLVAEYGMHAFVPPQQRLPMLAAAAERGCSLEETDLAGLTPLQAAVLLNDAQAARILLKSGAAPYRTVSVKREAQPNRTAAENAWDFLNRLAEAERQTATRRDRTALFELLAPYRR